MKRIVALLAAVFIGIMLMPGQAHADTGQNKCYQKISRVFYEDVQKIVEHNEYRFKRDIAAVDEVSHQEFRYEKDTTPSHTEYRWSKETRTWIPEVQEKSHTEYRYRVRTKLYGEKEIKDVKGWNFVDGGTTRVNGVNIPGHWAQGNSGTWYTIPDVVINAVWGSGGVPNSVLGTGSVSLNVYGGPNVTVNYNAHKIQTNDGYTNWSNWSDWSSTNSGGNTDTREVESRKIIDTEHVDAHWSDWKSAGWTDWSVGNTKPVDTDDTRFGSVETRLVKGTPSKETTDWITDILTAPWVKIDERKVVTTEPVDGYTEYYVKNDNPSRNKDDATWIPNDVLNGWVQFDKRVIKNTILVPGKPYYVTQKHEVPCPNKPKVPVATGLPNTGAGDNIALGFFGIGMLALGIYIVRRAR